MPRAIPLLTALAVATTTAACSASAAGPAPVVTSHRPPPAVGAPLRGRTVVEPRTSVPPARGGRFLVESIPGTRSGFVARPALVYLPPVTQKDPSRRLPVLVLMHGTSAGPFAWLGRGELATVLPRLAEQRGGVTPIVVMPDINGSRTADTECVGRAENYLAADVPAWISAHLPAAPRARWATAGMSEGGTCALMLSLRHPTVFPAFADLGGLKRPTFGEHDNPAATVRALFGGSWTAYQQHDPTSLLAHSRYPGLTGWFECGASDPARRDQDEVVRLAHAAGITVVDGTIPGAHSWSVWTRAVAQALYWFAARTRTA